MKEAAKYIIGRMGLFFLCGCIYYCIELLYRGYSDSSMFLLAGCLAVFCIDTPNDIFSFNLDYRWQVLISTVLCTIGEGITGVIVNLWLHKNVWDYTGLWGTFFYGQCNVIFVLAWALLVGLIAIPLCDAYNYYICGMEPCPYYRIGKRVWRPFKEKS